MIICYSEFERTIKRNRVNINNKEHFSAEECSLFLSEIRNENHKALLTRYIDREVKKKA